MQELDFRPHKIGGQSFLLPTHIRPLNIIGKGSYGVVISGEDSSSGNKVAIKRIKPFAGDEWEARHTLREIQLMRLLDVHPNIVSLSDLWTREIDNELYITMELLDSDLHQIIQSKQSLSEPHHQCLMKQLLLGVQAMHTCGVLHRDLKPGNLLVTRDCQLRITDFGLARAWSTFPDRTETNVGAMTEYVVTRWYRCPELLLAPHLPYHGAIDMWSVGCIFAELVTRRPLFPGKSYVHQVQVILDVLGTPSMDDFGFTPREDASAFLKRQKHRAGMSWAQILPQGSPRARDLLAQLLCWDPNRRLTVDQALAHPWLVDSPALPVASVSKETMLAHKEAQNITLAFEDPNAPLPELKAQIQEEVGLYRSRGGMEQQQQQQKHLTPRHDRRPTQPHTSPATPSTSTPPSASSVVKRVQATSHPAAVPVPAMLREHRARNPSEKISGRRGMAKKGASPTSVVNPTSGRSFQSMKEELSRLSRANARKQLPTVKSGSLIRSQTNPRELVASLSARSRGSDHGSSSEKAIESARGIASDRLVRMNVREIRDSRLRAANYGH